MRRTLICVKIRQSDTNEVCEIKVTVTSEQHAQEDSSILKTIAVIPDNSSPEENGSRIDGGHAVVEVGRRSFDRRSIPVIIRSHLFSVHTRVSTASRRVRGRLIHSSLRVHCVSMVARGREGEKGGFD